MFKVGSFLPKDACKSDRSRQELSNECLVVKFGFDTAENEPYQVRTFELSEILNLNFEISKLLVAAQASFSLQISRPSLDRTGVLPRSLACSPRVNFVQYFV